MPRSAEARLDAVLKFVGRKRAQGATSADVAAALGIPERAARSYLARLHTAGKLARSGEYLGTPPVFHYRYSSRSVRSEGRNG